MVVGVLLVVLALREWHGRPATRLARYEDQQRMVFGRTTYQTFAQILGSDADQAGYDPAAHPDQKPSRNRGVDHP